MNKKIQLFASMLVIGLLASLSLQLAAQDDTVEPITRIQKVLWNEDLSEVEGSEAILTRMEHGISMTMTTRGLEPGHAYTAWWIIFNAPENCSDSVCGFDDVFLMDDVGQFILDDEGLRLPNFAGREITQASTLRATGAIVYEDGTATFRAHLPIGDLTDAVLGGPGLLNPMGADVHFGLRSHGPALPDMLDEQLFTEWGGCPDRLDRSPCKNTQIAIFLPPPS